VLSFEGFSASGAADGVEALERMRQQEPPALIFVDLMMPRMDGNDLIRTMAADPSLARVPIAIISGQLTAESHEPAPQIVARLVKPVELDDLLTVVHRVTDAPGNSPSAASRKAS
jgi:chemosensory pili system protein ChpA (sensor histidine kinase/response regulator)